MRLERRCSGLCQCCEELSSALARNIDLVIEMQKLRFRLEHNRDFRGDLEEALIRENRE